MLTQGFRYLDAKYASRIFSFALIVGYGVMSLAGFVETSNESYLDVAVLALLSSLTIFVFSEVDFTQIKIAFPRVSVGAMTLLGVVFVAFYAFVLTLLLTAEAIPLVAWFSGADQETLVVLREEFLKAREGWQAIFPYINSTLTGALLPYCLAYVFLKDYKWRWFVFGSFLIYCVIFIEKVFFLKAILPLMYVMYVVRRGSKLSLLVLCSASALIVLALGIVSGFGSDAVAFDDHYFSNEFRAVGTSQFLVWRAIAVPVFTAADSISFFVNKLHSELMFGATSGLLSGFLGQDRVYFERLVFEYQWGQTPTGTGSSNAAFFIDAYVNFGFLGVVVISALIGLLFKFIRRSEDQALHSVWPLFAFGLYVSGFVGNLASNGFLLVFLVSAFVKLRPPSRGVVNNGFQQ